MASGSGKLNTVIAFGRLGAVAYSRKIPVSIHLSTAF
jgi:hypothetical protein